ncbi:alpha/beta fold hydrolase [Kitasatospora sp. NPDC056184]|uniref:alpha/beta fold hydrolase n=1 Tax=Kitasatospora sp. NPDC056184 TaxID=3345738 RepID=UPI0035DC4FC3
MNLRRRSHPLRRRRALAVALALSACATALALPGAAAAGEASGAAAPAPSIAWGPCPKSEPPMPDPTPAAQCATVQVPVDWARPNGPKTGIFVARHRATDPSRRIGVLLSNPGGPGAPGAEDALYAGIPDLGVYGPEMLERFDLVGFDPRGIGRSRPAPCEETADDESSADDESTAEEAAEFPQDAAAFERLRAANGRTAAGCLRAMGPLAAHLDTESVARDMDAIRAALGERRISYLGHSYGTLLGERYARLFPERLRAMALDSAVDPDRPDAERYLTDSSATVDAMFEQLAAWCATAPDCALRPRGLAAVTAELFARADAGTLREPGPQGPGPVAVDADRLSGLLTFLLLSRRPDWAAEQLAAVDSGRGEVSWPGPGGRNTAMQLVMCRDFDFRIRDYAEYRAIRARVARAAPHVRVSTYALAPVLGCQGWTLPPRARPAQARGDLPPVLVANAVHDPATPLPGARRMARAFPGARVLTVDTPHWVYYDPAARAAIDAHLLAPRR